MAKVIRIDAGTKQAKTRLRVAAYCRVSTDSADQLNSYARQVRVYRELIESRRDWELADIFADEGISGTSAGKRPEFLRMIKMCELREIDLIITKSVSRFARNVKEALEYVRKLKRLGVSVLFEKEGINTQSMADEMLLNTFAAIAQEESVAISQNVRLANRKRMADGEYNNGSLPYGFVRRDGILEPYEPEASVVKQIYDSYLNGDSVIQIAAELTRRGIPTKTGKHRWQPERISEILKNEKNIGDSLFQKQYTTDFPFKLKKNRGEEDQYYAENTHTGIVSRDVFDAAMELMRKRAEKCSHKNGIREFPFTGKLYCGECGAILGRKVSNGRERWCCRNHLYDSGKCSAHYVQTERIEDGFTTMGNKLRFGGDVLSAVEGQLASAIQQYRLNDDGTVSVNREIAELNGQMLMLEQLYGKGYIAQDLYRARSAEISARLSELKLAKGASGCVRLEEALKQIRSLKSKIERIEDPEVAFDPDLFEDIVVSGTLSENDELTLEFIGGLKFTEEI